MRDRKKVDIEHVLFEVSRHPIRHSRQLDAILCPVGGQSSKEQKPA